MSEFTTVLEVNTERCRVVRYVTLDGRKRILEITEGEYDELMEYLDSTPWGIDEILDCSGQDWEH